MVTMFKIELKRAFANKLFFIALLIGLIISVSHVIQYVYPEAQYLVMSASKGFFPDSVFNSWLGGNYHTLQNYVFFLILPILAVIPYSDSFFMDSKQGYIRNVFIRTNKKNYYIAKYVTTFIIGGIVVCIPLLVNLVLTASVIPSGIPNIVSGTYSIFPLSMWCDIFYTNPYLYVFMYLCLDFIFAGIFATIALTCSFYLPNRFMVLLSPFIIFYFYSTILKLQYLDAFDPFSFLKPCQPIIGITFISIMATMLISIFISAGIFFWKGIKNEVF